LAVDWRKSRVIHELFDQATANGFELKLLNVGGGFEDGTFELFASVLKEGGSGRILPASHSRHRRAWPILRRKRIYSGS